ncbi:putative anion transporter 4, chloroplastic [Tetrabaena socialis]|uniref:Putative anion transporter 4, chloroplastic n=1 Tax=Tetrabaena socialis TaxID=47790 RepID=A0A2J8A457_9CHLO|nr:putative anion transporter 4, chloroplastic [Tetrabaena socialis]|eukprot:PNH07310.1 putative anion transporter 4, chloroplastic [Tetrabaena socialis]
MASPLPHPPMSASSAFAPRLAVLSTIAMTPRRRAAVMASHRQVAKTVKITRRGFGSRHPSSTQQPGLGLPSGLAEAPTTSSLVVQAPQRPADATQAAEPHPFRWAYWDAQPSRYKLILGTALSFVVCNLDKVNLSVCIIPMAREFGWSPTMVGLVQSAFFWGYMLCQLPGGYFNSLLGGRRILPAGVLLYSAATGVVPWAAATLPGLCISRALVGFGQATAPSAATDIIARAVPSSERARAVTFIFCGFHVGSILGLLAAPWLIVHAGWRSVFVTFGALGFFWWWWFEQGIMAGITANEPDFAARLVCDSRSLMAPTSSSSPSASASLPAAPAAAAAAPAPARAGIMAGITANEPDFAARLVCDSRSLMAPTSSSSPSASASLPAAPAAAAAAPPPLPWRAFLRSTPVRALAYTHFANNWFHYTMLAWLPTYFVDTLSVDLMHASQTALLPPLAGIAASATAGAAADALISRGVPVPAVRKLAQNIAFLLPTGLLLAACMPEVGENSAATVAAITAALGISSCSLAGLFCTHQDMSPKYASILLGLTNTTAAIPGVLGVASVGFLFERTHSWEAALFLPSAFFMVTAAFTYTLWGRNEAIDFDSADNAAFAWEPRLQALRSTLGLDRQQEPVTGASGSQVAGAAEEEEQAEGLAQLVRRVRVGSSGAARQLRGLFGDDG